MSNDAFDSNGPQQYSNDGGFSGVNPPPKKSRTWLWVLGIVFGLGFLGLIVCCGLMTFGFSKYGSVVFEPVRGELNQSAQVQENVGNVEELTMNFSATVKEAEANPEFVILDAVTETGPQQFSVKMGAAGEVEEAYLVQPDGTRLELEMTSSNSDLAPFDESDISTGELESDEPVDAAEQELRDLESSLELN
ncbi:hypothetical protein SAMN06265222_10985 [Neorhodopirellula lusitana]|uniref:Cytochrome oxidase complex assembly protein 1 n=1 Tax=Neorhodopirellula lusitana TaxID=445327 RepID=A0ABY1QEM7_9BACT|nr:hypothetical protein [Neorhodopirellula lusitana]SMP65557.1 hypothetical protein SAMN06265222_10985 [Neorhodopirellula lusitana]